MTKVTFFKRTSFLAVCILLVLAILAAAMPIPAMAATTSTCEKTYTIKEGDTRASVAAATGMKWSDIAALNNLKPDKKLVPGDKLCYTTKIKPPLSFTAVLTGDKVRVTSRNATGDQIYFVRARDASRTSGGWYDLGRLKTFKTMPSQTSFNVPKQLKGISPLMVCFKEGETHTLTCVKSTK